MRNVGQFRRPKTIEKYHSERNNNRSLKVIFNKAKITGSQKASRAILTEYNMLIRKSKQAKCRSSNPQLLSYVTASIMAF